jgi:hypothetical protein
VPAEDRLIEGAMLVLEILGGWFLTSCIAAPFIGRFIAANATIVEEEPVTAIEAGLQPARSY